jgi:uncharacterized membrane protein YfcA
LLGFGGAIIVIPVLTIFLHYDQHLSQAAAMIVNVFVALPALVQHQRAGAVRWEVVARILPIALVMIVVGVEVSDRLPGELLRRAFGIFLVYLVIASLLRLSRDRRPEGTAETRTGFGLTTIVGSTTGFLAGLLGIGGGPVAVPLLNRACGLPLRQAVAAGTAVVCLISVVGAARKNAALAHLTDGAGIPLRLEDSLWIAACIVPTAMVGALIGAGLTHRLPLASVRFAFIVLVSWAGIQMLA